MPNELDIDAHLADSPAVPDFRSARPGDTSGWDQQTPGPLAPPRPSTHGAPPVAFPESSVGDLPPATRYLRTAGGLPIQEPSTSPVLTTGDVIALVVQRLQAAGQPVTISPESMDAATTHAELLLAVLGASRI